MDYLKVCLFLDREVSGSKYFLTPKQKKLVDENVDIMWSPKWNEFYTKPESSRYGITSTMINKIYESADVGYRLVPQGFSYAYNNITEETVLLNVISATETHILSFYIHRSIFEKFRNNQSKNKKLFMNSIIVVITERNK